MPTTEHMGWPLPDEAATVKEEIVRLRDQTLPSIDDEVHALGVAVEGKAEADHDHEIADVAGLATALADKMPADATFGVDDLTDVVGADAAPDGYVLVKVGGQWVAQAALAAIGDHDHTMGQVDGLEAALLDLDDTKAPLASPVLTGNPTAPTQTAGNNSNRIANTAFVQAALGALDFDPWLMQPIGVPIGLSDDLVGVSAPPKDKVYRYAKLTASDTYNIGFLTGETLTGTAPNIMATAVVSLIGSPINGQTIDLINTERRFLRAGSSGTKEQSPDLSHTHTATISSVGNHTHTIGGSGNGFSTGGGGSHGHTATINAATIPGAVPPNLGVTYFMRIK